MIDLLALGDTRKSSTRSFRPGGAARCARNPDGIFAVQARQLPMGPDSEGRQKVRGGTGDNRGGPRDGPRTNQALNGSRAANRLASSGRTWGECDKGRAARAVMHHLILGPLHRRPLA